MRKLLALLIVIVFIGCSKYSPKDQAFLDNCFAEGYKAGKWANPKIDSVFKAGWRCGFENAKDMIERSGYQLDSGWSFITYGNKGSDTSWDYHVVPKKKIPVPLGDIGSLYIAGPYNNPDSLKVLEKRFHLTIIKHK